MSTDTDVQTAAATQLDEDGASSAVSPTLGAAVVLAKYPTLLLAVLVVGVLSRDIQPPLDYAIPDSSPAANSSAEGLSRNEIRTTARAAKDENNNLHFLGVLSGEVIIDPRHACWVGADKHTNNTADLG